MDKKSKIYVAVPDADLFRALRSQLEFSNHRIQETMDWGMIPEEVALFGADLVLLHVDLPSVDGIDVVRQLKQEPRSADKPVIAIVGDRSDPRRAAVLDAGANDVLELPTQLSELEGRVDVLLGGDTSIDVDFDPDLLMAIDDASKTQDGTDPPVFPEADELGADRPLGLARKGIDSHYEQDVGVFIEVAEALASSLSTEDALYVVVRRISQVIPLRRCNIVLKGVKSDEAFVLASHDDANLRKREIDLGRYPEISRCLDLGETVLIDDVRKDPDMERVLDFITSVDLRSALVVPLYVREAVVGTLGLTSQREMHGFTRREMLFVRAMANLAAGLLAVSDLVESVRRDAASEKPPMEDIDEVVLDLEDQIEGLIEELDRK